MTNFFKNLFLLFLLTSCLAACQTNEKKYVIGVSQCSEDSWRTKLKFELEQSTYFNEDVELRIMSANDDVEEQKNQIRQLVKDNVDLLIVSPQQTKSLSDAIKEATDKKIPVIMFDRKSDVDNYTAFMGADNYAIGEMMGEYAAAQLGGVGNIIEIAGEHGSSPATERHRGFNDAIKRYPGLKIIAYQEGDWKQKSGEEAMNKILAKLNIESNKIRIDCVFGGNDRMALGARAALERYMAAHANMSSQVLSPNSIIYLGVDALPTTGGGIEKVRDGQLTASAIYPTHGDDLIALALAILKKEPYEKNTPLETSIVTSSNAGVLIMQYKEVVKQDEYIKKMHNRVDNILITMNTQRALLWGVIFIVVVVCSMLVITVRANRTKHRLNKELRLKNEELAKEKEKVERQRDELEEQRDQLLDATTKSEEPATEEEQHNPNLYQAPGETAPKNEFMEKFLAYLDKHLSDSDLGVEEIGREMCLSRVQLYRKVKAVTGRTPVEIIREERLKRANILLHDTSLTISEVAYRVGFSAPSYFTKCYKDYYGKAPSESDK